MTQLFDVVNIIGEKYKTRPGGFQSDDNLRAFASELSGVVYKQGYFDGSGITLNDVELDEILKSDGFRV